MTSLEGVPLALPPPEPAAAPLTSPSPVHGVSPEFSQLLESVGGAIDGGEALVGRAERAAFAPMDPGTLIALQAGIYRYSEAIDLTAKVVDRMTSALRTVLQSGH